MKIIFLDIDGVRNCKATPNPRDFPYIVDRKLLLRLKRLLSKSKAKIVISSTWRYDPIGIFAVKYWRIPFIDVTPDMPRRPRRDEILTWLKKHPDVTRFAVIDDDDDELDDLPLFQPSPDTGLTRILADGVYGYLAGKTERDMRSGAVNRLFQNVRTALQGHQG
jgi:HAD domain in Swiss Army Knife RNA repair proteins